MNDDVFVAHMLDAHQSNPYPCKQKDCVRVKMNGFDTKEQLKAHVKEDHIPEFPCTHSGCEKGYAVKWALAKHMKKEHAGEDAQVQNVITEGEEVDGGWVF